ncbi:hypothetical protein X975_22048, partial [Stegodyphus mimosarum]
MNVMRVIIKRPWHSETIIIANFYVTDKWCDAVLVTLL